MSNSTNQMDALGFLKPSRAFSQRIDSSDLNDRNLILPKSSGNTTPIRSSPLTAHRALAHETGSPARMTADLYSEPNQLGFSKRPPKRIFGSYKEIRENSRVQPPNSGPASWTQNASSRPSDLYSFDMSRLSHAIPSRMKERAQLRAEEGTSVTENHATGRTLRQAIRQVSPSGLRTPSSTLYRSAPGSYSMDCPPRRSEPIILRETPVRSRTFQTPPTRSSPYDPNTRESSQETLWEDDGLSVEELQENLKREHLASGLRARKERRPSDVSDQADVQLPDNGRRMALQSSRTSRTSIQHRTGFRSDPQDRTNSSSITRPTQKLVSGSYKSPALARITDSDTSPTMQRWSPLSSRQTVSSDRKSRSGNKDAEKSHRVDDGRTLESSYTPLRRRSSPYALFHSLPGSPGTKHSALSSPRTSPVDEANGSHVINLRQSERRQSNGTRYNEQGGQSLPQSYPWKSFASRTPEHSKRRIVLPSTRPTTPTEPAASRPMRSDLPSAVKLTRQATVPSYKQRQDIMAPAMGRRYRSDLSAYSRNDPEQRYLDTLDNTVSQPTPSMFLSPHREFDSDSLGLRGMGNHDASFATVETINTSSRREDVPPRKKSYLGGEERYSPEESKSTFTPSDVVGHAQRKGDPTSYRAKLDEEASSIQKQTPGREQHTVEDHIVPKRKLTYEEKAQRLLDGLRSIDLSGDIYDEMEFMSDCGGSGDIYKARSKRHGNTVVAVKKLRTRITNEKAWKLIYRELNVWSALNHPNILPLLGYAIHGEYPSLISKWMDNGSAREFLCKNPGRRAMHMSKGIAAGLKYLHEQGILHSDLKCDNILVSDTGEPLLADFGISRIVSATTVTTSTSAKGSVRWMAIELLSLPLDENDEPCKHTKETDIWALGMVIYELLSKQLPYHYLQNNLHISLAITNNRLPSQPSLQDGDDDILWSICQRCWSKIPRNRPDIAWIGAQLT